MKKLKSFVFCTLVGIHLIYSSLCSAGDNQIYTITNQVRTQQNTTSQIICVDGYKYLVTQTQDQSKVGVSVVQLMKDGKGVTYNPQPVKCNE